MTHGVDKFAYMFHNIPFPPIKRVELWRFISLGIRLAKELC